MTRPSREGEKKGGLAYDATATGGWAGITDKYWLTALIPDQALAVQVNFRHITMITATATRWTTSPPIPPNVAPAQRRRHDSATSSPAPRW